MKITSEARSEIMQILNSLSHSARYVGIGDVHQVDLDYEILKQYNLIGHLFTIIEKDTSYKS